MKVVCALLLTVFVVAEGYYKKGHFGVPYNRGLTGARGGYVGDYMSRSGHVSFYSARPGGYIDYRGGYGGDYDGGYIGGASPGFTGSVGGGSGGDGRFSRFIGGRSGSFGSYGGDDFGDDGFGGDGFSGAFNGFGWYRGGRFGRSYLSYGRGRRFHWQYDRCKCQRRCGKYKIYVGKCKTCRKCKLVMCCRYRRPKKGGGFG